MLVVCIGDPFKVHSPHLYALWYFMEFFSGKMLEHWDLLHLPHTELSYEHHPAHTTTTANTAVKSVLAESKLEWSYCIS